MKRIKVMMVLAIIISQSLYCNKANSPEEIRINKGELSSKEKDLTPTQQDNSEKETKNTREKTSTISAITSKDVKTHIGDSLMIRGRVADIYLSDKVAYLNFENKFPKNIFSCTVFSGRFDEFGDLSRFKDKNVEVIGKITTFKNKAQVILNSKDQIRIIQ